MASDVKELQFALDKIKKLASAEYLGASDRRRALIYISNTCVHAMQGTLLDSEKKDPS